MLNHNWRKMLLALCALAIPGLAAAADLKGAARGEEAQGAASGFIWTGLYAGLSAGRGWGQSTQSYNRNDNHGLAMTESDGMVGALTLGYNHQLSGGAVVGIEGDIGLLDVSADDKIVYDGHNYKTSFGPWWASVRGRLGYAWGPVLLYGTGGVALMGVDEVSIGNTPGETAYNRDRRSGWVAGGGIEYAFGSRTTLKAEYLHMDFGRYSGFSANQEDYYFDNELDLLRFGLNYMF